jgi:3-isopropylmalate dehydrogenase
MPLTRLPEAQTPTRPHHRCALVAPRKGDSSDTMGTTTENEGAVVTGARRTYVIACLAGNGIGPEVTAAASRALAQVSRQHGFRVEEVHPPFDGEAVVQAGHPLPAATRRAALTADAVLVAGAAAPALEGVKAELDLAVQATRTIAADGSGTTAFSPLPGTSPDPALERAFAAARARGGRLSSVGVSDHWWERVAVHAAGNEGVEVAELPLAAALEALTGGGGGLGVLAVEGSLADAVTQAPRWSGRRMPGATGYLSLAGTGLFAPMHGAAQEIAGHGVANPSEMLLAAALLLGEGLGRRAAAEALEESLAAALGSSVQTPDVAQAGVAATTREFVDAVLALLPSARRDTEFALGVTR